MPNNVCFACIMFNKEIVKKLTSNKNVYKWEGFTYLWLTLLIVPNNIRFDCTLFK